MKVAPDLNDTLCMNGPDAVLARYDNAQTVVDDDELEVFNAGKKEMPPPRGWLLGNSFSRGYVSQVQATGGVGKTTLRLLQGTASATGRNLSGEHIFVRCRVLFVSLEDDILELNRRLIAIQLYHGIADAELDGWLFTSAPRGKSGKLMEANGRSSIARVGKLAGRIEKAIVKYKIDLLIIDPLVKAHALPENDNALMDQLATLLTDIAIELDVAIDIPHHVSKGHADPGNADKGRGASSTVNAARIVHTLSPMSEDEAQYFGIPIEERHDYVRYDRAKINIARKSGAAVWFKLINRNIGNANDLYPHGDDVQTMERWDPPSPWAGLDNATIRKILDTIAAGVNEHECYSMRPKVNQQREAWRVVTQFAPDKTEPQARAIIRKWAETGLLTEFTYANPKSKEVKGLKVDDSKRPGQMPETTRLVQIAGAIDNSSAPGFQVGMLVQIVNDKDEFVLPQPTGITTVYDHTDGTKWVSVEGSTTAYPMANLRRVT
jgi:hypothetical protein